MNIPEDYKYLFTGKHFAHIATINPDGSPQVTPVWIDLDEKNELIIFNTAKGRKKDKNLSMGSKVALSIQDSDDPYIYIAIQGTVVDKTEEGALDHIKMLANRYFGRDFKRDAEEIRLKISIEPRYVFKSGK